MKEGTVLKRKRQAHCAQPMYMWNQIINFGKIPLNLFCIYFDSGIRRWEKNWARKKVMPSVGWTYFCPVTPLCVRFSYLLPATLCLEEQGTNNQERWSWRNFQHSPICYSKCAGISLCWWHWLVSEGVSWGKRLLFGFWEYLILPISRGRGIFIMVLDFLLGILCSCQVRRVIWNFLFLPQPLQIA